MQAGALRAALDRVQGDAVGRQQAAQLGAAVGRAQGDDGDGQDAVARVRGGEARDAAGLAGAAGADEADDAGAAAQRVHRDAARERVDDEVLGVGAGQQRREAADGLLGDRLGQALAQAAGDEPLGGDERGGRQAGRPARARGAMTARRRARRARSARAPARARRARARAPTATGSGSATGGSHAAAGSSAIGSGAHAEVVEHAGGLLVGDGLLRSDDLVVLLVAVDLLPLVVVEHLGLRARRARLRRDGRGLGSTAAGSVDRRQPGVEQRREVLGRRGRRRREQVVDGDVGAAGQRVDLRRGRGRTRRRVLRASASCWRERRGDARHPRGICGGTNAAPGRTSTSISRLAKNPPTPPLVVSRRDTMTASSPSSCRMRGTSSSSERPR